MWCGCHGQQVWGGVACGKWMGGDSRGICMDDGVQKGFVSDLAMLAAQFLAALCHDSLDIHGGEKQLWVLDDGPQIGMSTSYTHEYEYLSEIVKVALVLDSYSLVQVLLVTTEQCEYYHPYNARRSIAAPCHGRVVASASLSPPPWLWTVVVLMRRRREFVVVIVWLATRRCHCCHHRPESRGRGPWLVLHADRPAGCDTGPQQYSTTTSDSKTAVAMPWTMRLRLSQTAWTRHHHQQQQQDGGDESTTPWTTRRRLGQWGNAAWGDSDR
ncbi:hypothetical protein EDB89DRAFT_1913872 [Lactarius sanguifluus]|nr:hypothetical protein EDB89DRAFT_1913872 [Lactarius sanguifluus]